jgi:glyoxylase-like metal-dependent hydrolase (beta-lactamase superfamily II)
VIAEGQPIVIGDLKVQPVAIPGHTPVRWDSSSR